MAATEKNLQTFSKADMKSLIESNWDLIKREIEKTYKPGSVEYKKALKAASSRKGVKLPNGEIISLRKFNNGIPSRFILSDDGRIVNINSVGAFARSEGALPLQFTTSTAGKVSKRSLRTESIVGDIDTNKWVDQLDFVTDLRQQLNDNKITEADFHKTMKAYVKKNKIDIGLGTGKYNANRFNKSLTSQGWPKGASKEGYIQFLKNNYKASQILAADLTEKTGIFFDAGHPNAGSPNISLARQLRYHISKGNRNIIDLLPEFKGMAKKATEEVLGRNPLDMNVSAIPYTHGGAFSTYLNKYLPDSKTIDFELLPENLKSSILFDHDYSVDADSGVMKALKELDDQAGISFLRRKNPINNPGLLKNISQEMMAKLEAIKKLPIKQRRAALRALTISGGITLYGGLGTGVSAAETYGRYQLYEETGNPLDKLQYNISAASLAGDLTSYVPTPQTAVGGSAFSLIADMSNELINIARYEPTELDLKKAYSNLNFTSAIKEGEAISEKGLTDNTLTNKTSRGVVKVKNEEGEEEYLPILQIPQA